MACNRHESLALAASTPRGYGLERHVGSDRRISAAILGAPLMRFFCLVLLAVATTACGTPHGELASGAEPADIARAMCIKSNRDQAACQNLQLPDPSSTLAYPTCLEYHRLDVKACSDLRSAYEGELRAYLVSTAPSAATPSAAPEQPPTLVQQENVPYQTAAALYKATSTDAQTFTAALLIPEVRRKVEAALRQSLSDDKLRKLADQAKAESLHWYAYLQRLERQPGGG